MDTIKTITQLQTLYPELVQYNGLYGYVWLNGFRYEVISNNKSDKHDIEIIEKFIDKQKIENVDPDEIEEFLDLCWYNDFYRNKQQFISLMKQTILTLQD